MLMLTQMKNVVAIGGGHGLGRVMSSLSFLKENLSGIVTTTDNGGSTGRIRLSEGGIAWGDIRNCINQLITEPSTASSMFEYRFSGKGALSGHNLGNLMLKALDNMCVRPLEAINLVRSLLKVDVLLLPMSEQSSDLVAITREGTEVYGEIAVDQLKHMPKRLMVIPAVKATQEAITAINQAKLIIIGPGSFMTSILPPLLLQDIADALNKNKAPIIYIDNLGKELSPAAHSLTLQQKIAWLESYIGTKRISAILTAEETNCDNLTEYLIIQQPLAAKDIPYRHDRQRLIQALERALVQMAK